MSKNGEERSVTLQSLTLRNDGDGNDNLKNIIVYRGSEVISKDVTINGRNLIVTFKNEILDANKVYNYSLRAEVTYVDSKAGDEYNFVLNKAEDLVAKETNTQFRTRTIEGSNADAFNLGSYTINGGNIILEGVTDFGSSLNASKGSKSVVISKGTISVKEPIMLENITIPLHVVGYTQTGDTKLENLIDKVSLKIGATTIGKITANMTGNAAASVAADAISVYFENAFYITNNTTVELSIDLDNNAQEGVTIKADPLKLSYFERGEYSNNQNIFSTLAAGV
ncbi:MAG: hypothetical protein LBG59_07135 [Candidatus Peribacteria bacterium]|nr:hypothetical protein [Candidatus Peribacteria bacterium]